MVPVVVRQVLIDVPALVTAVSCGSIPLETAVLYCVTAVSIAALAAVA